MPHYSDKPHGSERPKKAAKAPIETRKALGPSFTVEGLERPSRLDRVLAEHYVEHGRRALVGLIMKKKVLVNGRLVWLASWQVNDGDVISLLVPLPEKKPAAAAFSREWVVGRGADWLAINKPAGLLSHATRATDQSDLQTLVREKFGPMSLFHRLDRDTSGLVLFTNHGPINKYMDTAFKEGLIEKVYWALCEEAAPLNDEFEISARLAPDPQKSERMRVVEKGGQSALTRVKVLGREGGLALLRCELVTGRTHQIRVHLQSVGAPILGDRFYNPHGRQTPRLMLHALSVVLPELDGYPKKALLAPLPPDFVAVLPPELKKVAEKAKAAARSAS